MSDCAAPTESVALKAGCAYAGVFKNWQAVVVRKKPEDLLGDNINHPNEFGPWIFRVSSELGL
jgi:acyl-CoA thioesterase-1